MGVVKFGEKSLRKVCKKYNPRMDSIGDINYSITKFIRKDKTVISAKQVGYLKRVFVVRYGNTNYLFINPLIKKLEGDKNKYEQICMSLNMAVKTERYNKIRIKYLDEELNECNNTFEGEMAALIQQGFDYLNGKMICDFLSDDEFNKIINNLIAPTSKKAITERFTQTVNVDWGNRTISEESRTAPSRESTIREEVSPIIENTESNNTEAINNIINRFREEIILAEEISNNPIDGENIEAKPIKIKKLKRSKL